MGIEHIWTHVLYIIRIPSLINKILLIPFFAITDFKFQVLHASLNSKLIDGRFISIQVYLNIQK